MIRNPLVHGLLWNPVIVAVPFANLASTAYLRGFPFGRTGSAAFVGLWFGGWAQRETTQP